MFISVKKEHNIYLAFLQQIKKILVPQKYSINDVVGLIT